uniref:Putative RecF/RecN/SMC domain contining protein n=1 Tax=viral metagenome TaxID=1070528 RepID=A0A6M3LJX9_9ZZZZ
MLAKYNERLLKEKGARDSQLAKIEGLKLKLWRLSRELIHTEEATTIIQEVAKETQGQVKVLLSELVTYCLQYIHGEEGYEFQVEFKERGGGGVDCIFTLKKGGEVFDIFYDAGGGIADIISIGLRLSIFGLSPTSKVILLDEPFRNLSNNYHELAAKCLKEISERLGVQFIIITHSEEFIAHAERVFRFEKEAWEMFTKRQTFTH